MEYQFCLLIRTRFLNQKCQQLVGKYRTPAHSMNCILYNCFRFTKHEVKMTGYWPPPQYNVVGRGEVKVDKNDKRKERSQGKAILIKQA